MSKGVGGDEIWSLIDAMWYHGFTYEDLRAEAVKYKYPRFQAHKDFWKVFDTTRAEANKDGWKSGMGELLGVMHIVLFWATINLKRVVPAEVESYRKFVEVVDGRPKVVSAKLRLGARG